MRRARRYGAVLRRNDSRLLDADDRCARVVRAGEHRHRDQRRVAAVAAARDADLAAPCRCARTARGRSGRVLDVGDHVEALRAVVGVEPRLAVAVAAAHVRLDEDEARVRRRSGDRSRSPGVACPSGSAVEHRRSRGTDRCVAFSSGRTAFGKRTNAGIGVPSFAGYVTSFAGTNDSEVDLRRGRHEPLRERLASASPRRSSCAAPVGVRHAERDEASVARRRARDDVIGVARQRQRELAANVCASSTTSRV